MGESKKQVGSVLRVTCIRVDEVIGLDHVVTTRAVVIECGVEPDENRRTIPIPRWSMDEVGWGEAARRQRGRAA